MMAFYLHLLMVGQFAFGNFNPDVDWQTIETEHFYFHYAPSYEEEVRGLAGRAEPIYDRITERVSWEPSAKTHIVMLDEPDPNGLATPIPYNTIYLYMTPPADSSSLDDYDDWLTLLFAHEFTHTVHIDMATGVNRFLRAILGRTIVPNSQQPQWLIEGLAMYHETVETTEGRGRSSYLDMYFRTMAMADKWEPIERATYYNDRYPYGNSAYWYGVGFHKYLAKNYGEKKIYELARANSRWLMLFPGFFNFKTDDIYGKSFDRLWEEWREEEQTRWKATVAKRTPRYEGTMLDEKDILVGKPTWNEDGSILYASISRDNRGALVAYHIDPKTGEFKERKVIRKGLIPRALFFESGALYYSKKSYVDRHQTTYDLFQLNLENKKETRLTRGLRLQDPVVRNGAVYAVHVNRYQSHLVELPKFDVEKKDFKAFEDIRKLRFHYSAPGFSRITKPSVSSNGKRVAFSMKRSQGFRDIYVLDLATKDLRRLTSDPYLDNDPQFVGNKLVFNSDRPLPGTKTPVWNTYNINLANNRITPQTDVWTGTNWPTPKGKHLAHGYYTTEGFRLYLTSNKAAGPARALVKQRDQTKVPPILGKTMPKPRTDLESRDYSAGSTLLPHYLLPFFFLTDEDSAFGAITGSNDPLSFHRWSGFAYFLTNASFDGANRPGGALSYTYSGLGSVDLFMGATATITNYGNISVVNIGNSTGISADDFYERQFRGFFGLTHSIHTDNGPTGVSFRLNAYGEARRTLFGHPTGAPTTDIGSVTFTDTNTTVTGVQLRPLQGNLWGAQLSLDYSLGYKKDIDGIAPYQGGNISLMVDYTPDGLASDFHRLTTILEAKYYLETFKHQSIAVHAAFGNQWLDTLYQKTFLMGGSIGSGPFSMQNRRRYALRGLPASALLGEGIVKASAEYRFPVFRYIPGFGTAPFWVKNIHGAFFSDVGQVFQYQSAKNYYEIIGAGARPQDLDYDRFTVSVGAELRTDVSVSYAPPLTFRIGYGYVLYYIGDWRGSDQIDQFYFHFGQSF